MAEADANIVEELAGARRGKTRVETRDKSGDRGRGKEIESMMMDCVYVFLSIEYDRPIIDTCFQY